MRFLKFKQYTKFQKTFVFFSQELCVLKLVVKSNVIETHTPSMFKDNFIKPFGHYFYLDKKQGWIHSYPSCVQVGRSSAGEGH